MKKSLLIILDLNGVLLARIPKSRVSLARQHNPNFPSRPADFSISKGNTKVYLRPHARDFLSRLLSYNDQNSTCVNNDEDNNGINDSNCGEVKVAIWTSAMAHNREVMVNNLVPDVESRKKFLFFWSRDECVLKKRQASSLEEEEEEVKASTEQANILDDEGKGDSNIEITNANETTQSTTNANTNETTKEKKGIKRKCYRAPVNNAQQYEEASKRGFKPEFLPIAHKPISKVFNSLSSSPNLADTENCEPIATSPTWELNDLEPQPNNNDSFVATPLNSLIIDDSAEKLGLENTLENAIVLPEFSIAEPGFDSSKDTVLRDLYEYLDGYMKNTDIFDIRQYLKEFPFPNEPSRSKGCVRETLE